MKLPQSLFFLLLPCSMVQSAEILISGFLANPAGTDSPYEYVQLMATQSIDFATTNYSVVWNNNGTALANGWITGGSLSYGFNLNSGSVAAGEVFYVGGSGKLINGVGSTDLSSQKWIRTIPTGTTAGDSFGSLNTGGVLGNGGGNADGIAIFSFSTSSLTSTTVPVDAVFFGTGVGTAKPATGGYVVPDNDFYDGGVFGGTGSTALLPDAGSAEFIKLTGTYDPSLNLWSVPRSGSTVALTTTSAASAIASSLTLIPEPSVSAMGLLALTLLGRRKRA